MGTLHTFSEVIGIIRDLLLIVVFIGFIVFILALITLVQATLPLVDQANTMLGGFSGGPGLLPTGGGSVLPIPSGTGSGDGSYSTSISDIMNDSMAGDIESAGLKMFALKNECQGKGNTDCVEKISEIEQAVLEQDILKLSTLFSELEETLK